MLLYAALFLYISLYIAAMFDTNTEEKIILTAGVLVGCAVATYLYLAALGFCEMV
jgi:hypothetical protein|nr:MAG TPA: hypothetical protein [Caudoviricetes sp.]